MWVHPKEGSGRADQRTNHLLRSLFGSMAAVALCVLAAHLLAGGAA